MIREVLRQVNETVNLSMLDGDELVCVAEAPEAARALWMVVHPDLRRAARVRATMDNLVDIARALRG